MSDQFIGEIRIVGFDFAPEDWALCNGQLLAISQNAALFSLLGTTYGGDGVSTFALPNLQSRVPVHMGQGVGLSPYVIGQQSGVENVTLLTSNLPAHNHPLSAAATGGNTASPASAYPAVESTGTSLNYSTTAGATMATAAIGLTGNGIPVTNIQPYLTVNFIIALVGIFPSRS